MLNNETLNFLSAVGATTLENVQGQADPVDHLFEDGDTPLSSHLDSATYAQFSSHLASIPVHVMTALHFFFNETTQIVGSEYTNISTPAGNSKGSGHTRWVNLKQAKVDLSSLYGSTHLSGDFGRIIAKCIPCPWDSAKLWITTGPPFFKGQGDILRLHTVLTGDRAILQEADLIDVPNHLNHRFLKEGDWNYACPIISDPRNDRSLLLSQFHFALGRLHNSFSESSDRLGLKNVTRSELFDKAKAETTRTFATSIGMIAARLLNQKNTPSPITLQRRYVQTFEGASLLQQLLCSYPWPDIYPNPKAEKARHLLPASDQFSFGSCDMVHDVLLNSPRLGRQLSERLTIDWMHILNSNIKGAKPTQPLNLALIPSDILKSVSFSGEQVAKLVGHSPISNGGSTPLIPYIIREALLFNQKGRLGPVGSFVLETTLRSAVDHDTLAGEAEATLAMVRLLTVGRDDFEG